MPDICHAVQIAAGPDVVFPLVSTAPGFAQWWATDVTESPAGSVELAFFNRTTIYRLRRLLVQPSTTAEWQCETGEEWEGTRLEFRLEAVKNGTLLRFLHGGWRADTLLLRFVQHDLGRIDVPAEGRRRGTGSRSAVSPGRPGVLVSGVSVHNKPSARISSS